jgi:DNA-binding CsgD family transcriptional regulator/PAS domain-containing protein
MNQYQLYLVAAPLAAAMTMTALVVSARQAGPKRSRPLEGFLVCATMILILSSCELISATEWVILLFSHLTYVFLAAGPVFWFLFAYRCGTGKRIESSTTLALLFIVPSLTTAFAFFDGILHLIWQERGLAEIGAFRINVVLRYGPWFWVHCAYSYLLFLAGAIVILKELFSHYELYRRQALLVTGTLVPLVGNLLYVARVFPGIKKDFSPLALALSGMLFSVSIVKYRVLEINPPPRQKWAELIEDGVLIVNGEGLVVDANDAASRMLGAPAADLLGSPIEALLPGYSALTRGGRKNAAGSVECDAPAEGQGQDKTLSYFSRPFEGGRDGQKGACISLRGGSFVRRSTDRLLELSSREAEVAKLLATDLTLKQIGALLYISTNTVKTHERHILRKLGVGDREELKGLIEG